jgi:hypothetical protein
LPLKKSHNSLILGKVASKKLMRAIKLSSTMKKRIIFWFCFVLALVALIREFWPICPPPFPTWNCETQEINIKTGQARYRRYRFFVKIRDETKDTVLSKAIAEPVSVTDIEAWHTVNQFAPPSFQISPHYRFHGALSQVEDVEMLQTTYALGKSNVAIIARQLLTGWQTNGNYFAADRFLNDKMMELEQQRRVYSPAATRPAKPTP